MSILIVEDERIIALDIKAQLSKLGVKDVVITDNGKDALRIAREKDLDLIIMDINILGEMDGIQTASLIQKFKKIPVLFCTAYQDRNTKNQMGKIIHIGIMDKPIEEDELEKFIHNFFNYNKETSKIDFVMNG